MSFLSQQTFSVSFFHVSLGLPAPCLPSICISHAVLTAQLERSAYPNQQSRLSQNEVKVLKLASSSLDLTVATSSGLILQFCLGQWQSFTGMEHCAPHARAVYMTTGLVREVAGCIPTKSFSFFLLAVTAKFGASSKHNCDFWVKIKHCMLSNFSCFYDFIQNQLFQKIIS